MKYLFDASLQPDEKCGLSSPVFERKIDEKSPSFEIAANMTDDKSLMFFVHF